MAHGPDTERMMKKLSDCETNGFITLFLDRMHVDSIPYIPKHVKTLECECLDITCLPPLPDCLEDLICNNTKVESLPELPNTLTYLSVIKAPIKVIPRLPKKLRYLALSYTLIEECLNLEDNTQLETLYFNKSIAVVPPKLPKTLKYLICIGVSWKSMPELPESLILLLVSGNTLNVPRRKDNESHTNYIVRIREWDSKNRIQARNRLLFEEIVMEAWHPRKVDRWLQLGAEFEDL
jgi:hypothetical protein